MCKYLEHYLASYSVDLVVVFPGVHQLLGQIL